MEVILLYLGNLIFLTSNRGQQTSCDRAIWVLYSRRRKIQHDTKYYRGHRTLQVVVCSRHLVQDIMWVFIYISIFCSAKYKHGDFTKNIFSYGLLAITNVPFDVGAWNLA
jgi:hypothetical protein